MTTNITELAQSLKAAAENATPGEWCSDDQYGIAADSGLNGNYYIASCSGPEHRQNKRFIALANPANILALVEALEKAQQRNGELETYSKTALEFREAARDENRHLKLELEIAEKRIAELEEAEQNLCAANVTLDARAELAERQLAELESRTITVKLPPKIERNDIDGWLTYKGGRVGGGAAEWYNKALDDVISAQSTFVTVKLPEPYGYLRENDGQIQISIGAERPSDRSGGYATPWFAIYTAVGIKGDE